MNNQMLPQYNGQSTVNITSTILSHFGCETETPINTTLEQRLKGVEKVVFLFVDAMGYDQIKAEPKAEFLNELLKSGCAITACFPSTTASSVASFFTGLTPQQHGIVGFSSYVSELGGVVNMLKYYDIATKKDVTLPADFFPFETVGEKLSKQGVKAYAIMPYEIVDSAFNKMTMRGFKQYPHLSIAQLFHKLNFLLAEDGKMFIHAYIPSYDAICHLLGPDTDVPKHHLRGISQDLEEFASKNKNKGLIVISADHGQIKTNPAINVDYTRHPKLLSMLQFVGGESRMNYLYVRPGQRNSVKNYFDEHFADKALLIPSEDALAQGYFGLGKPYSKTHGRIGDLVMIAKENFGLNQKMINYHGMHGGISRTEMLVPLMTIEL